MFEKPSRLFPLILCSRPLRDLRWPPALFWLPELECSVFRGLGLFPDGREVCSRGWAKWIEPDLLKHASFVLCVWFTWTQVLRTLSELTAKNFTRSLLWMRSVSPAKSAMLKPTHVFWDSINPLQPPSQFLVVGDPGVDVAEHFLRQSFRRFGRIDRHNICFGEFCRMRLVVYSNHRRIANSRV